MGDLYSHITLSNLATDAPAQLPAELQGLSEGSLADLSAALKPVPARFTDVGYWPVDEVPVSFDPRTKTETGAFTLTIDQARKRVSATPELRNLTADEIAALPPLPFGTISDRQFFQALASDPYHLITPQEALDAVKTGEIPAVMQAVIDGMPTAQQFPATMLVAGATEFRRDNPLVAVFAASQNMNAAAVDALWRFAEGL